MRKMLLTLVTLVVLGKAFAGDNPYAVSLIPPALLKAAHSVVRYEEQRYEIRDVGHAVYYNKYVITILDEQGAKLAMAYKDYDSFSSIPSIEGKLYDADGKKIKSVKNSEVEDRSANFEGYLAVDNRIRMHNFYYKQYPYTIEYVIEQKENETMFVPSWNPMNSYNCAVEDSKMIITYPLDFQLRYKQMNLDMKPQEAVVKNDKSLTWEMKNRPCMQEESYGPYTQEIFPYVIFAPTQFQMQDHKGSMASWKDLGQFMQELRKGRDVLPDDIRQKVHSLTDQVNDPREKIRILYEFMQQNTRYVNVSLGIGGWQPFDASYVASKKYGDCKALSNYMYSLLKEAGIKSYYTLVRAGYGESAVPEDFPMPRFNHVIVSVPLKQDTMWLECTSQIEPAGYLGNFTSNRNVLWVDDNGSQLVRTPKYGIRENIQRRKVSAVVDADGNLKLNCASFYQGAEQDELYGLINTVSRDKVMEYLKSNIDIPQYDVVKYDYKVHKASLPSLDEQLDLTASNYAQVTGKRLFITPNILSKNGSKLLSDDTRQFDVILRGEFNDVDSVEITMPDGYTPEAVPEAKLITTKFGKYSSQVKIDGHTIKYYRSFERYSGHFPPTAYPDLVNFYDAIYRADRSKVVMVKNQ